MSEENTTQNPGLTLPDDAAPVSSVSATDRLLAFNEAGDPVTPTAEQVKEFANEGMATAEAMNAALAKKVALVPFSLTEQLVPGEFWMGADGVMRQVYVRTFIGDFALSSSRILLISGVHEVNILHGYANLRNVYRMPDRVIFTDDAGQISTAECNWFIYVASNSAYIAYSKDSREFNPSGYSLTIKYTKA